MSSRAETVLTSPDEYLEFERASEFRHEYVDGRVIEMAGGSRRHSRIIVNATSSLHPQLRATPCEVLAVSMRVRVSKKRDYVYPDVVVTCDADLEDEHQDSLLNPVVVIEVLSPSTQDYDHGRKWLLYQQVPTLQEYLLIAQERPQVERYSRQPDGSWLYRLIEDPDAVLRLDSIGCTLPVSEIYDKVFV